MAVVKIVGIAIVAVVMAGLALVIFASLVGLFTGS
jgi:hypothetical protein